MCVLQWSAETNASITAIFFKWLVGPLETKEVEVDIEGEQKIWRSGVQIKKCRYLEQSGCVGMCINMCKVHLQVASEVLSELARNQRKCKDQMQTL